MAGHDQTPPIHEHVDSWHHHSAAEGVPQHEHASVANPSVLLHWFILIVISGVLMIVALGMYFGKYYNTIRQQRIETIIFYDQNAKPRLIDSESKLGTGKPLSQFTFHAADKQAHTVQLPIEQAMQRVVDRYQSPKATQTPQTKP